MNQMNIFFIILINAIWITGFYFLIRKISKYRRQRILLPNRNISSYLSPLNELKEGKIRKNWLISFISLSLLSYISSTYMIFNMNDLILKTKILVSLFTFFSFLISIYLTYYCAYLKRGTAWLLWILITIPFSQLYSSFMQAAKKMPYLLPNWLQILLLTFTIFYWIQSLFLRNANLKRRYHNDAMYLKNYFESEN